jgi:sugar lactone lactonase YvrE
MEIEVVADVPCAIGECPLWHPGEGKLYWTDIPAGKLYRYDPVSGTHEVAFQGPVVGGMTLQADQTLLLFMERGTVAVWDGQGQGLARTIVPELPEERDVRFNDVIADPVGRVFCGTISLKDASGQVLRLGRLHRLDCDGSIRPVVEGVGTSNGMGFSPDRRTFYHTDTAARRIDAYDYDQASGAISHRRPFAQIPATPHNERPDGMTVDAAGNIWSALWEGGAIICLAPDGQLLRRIELPLRCPTSVCFAGLDLRDLYVTTAQGDQRPAKGQYAGALLRIRGLEAQGVPEFVSRIGC